VQAGAGDFAAGVEAGQGGGAIDFGHDAAAGIVCGGHHGNGIGGHVDAEAQAGGVEVGEAFAQERFGVVGDVEVDIRIAVFLHHEVDGAGGDIARGERAPFVELLHEGVAAYILQFGTFAAHGFGNEEGFGFRVVEAGGVELDKLHVADRQAGAPGHGRAIASGDIGVGGVGIDLPEPAGGEHGAGGVDREDFLRRLVEKIGADTTVFAGMSDPAGGDEVDGHQVFTEGDIGGFAGVFDENLHYFLAGDVARMQYAAVRVAALLPEVVFVFLAFVFPQVEFDAELFEFMNAVASTFHHLFHNRWNAQPAPGDEGVGHMRPEGVVGVDHTGDTALGVEAVALGGLDLAGHQHAPVPAQFQGGG